jgi:hypothetical protein
VDSLTLYYTNFDFSSVARDVMSISSFRTQSLMLAVLLCAHATAAGDAPKDSGKAAATCTHVSGVLLAKEASGAWKPVKEGAALPSGSLLVGMPKSEFVSASGAVQGRLLADIGQRGPFPVLEAGVVLHDAAGADLDLTFDRGLLVLENVKKQGDAKVRLRVRDEVWELQLRTPGTKVGLELFGRHPPGMPKTIDEKTDLPTTDVLMLVLQGQAFLDTGKEGMALTAPPGVARLHWDSVLRELAFQRLEKLPETIVKPLDDRETKIFQELSAGAAKLARGDLGAGLDELTKSISKVDRLAGVTLAGAVDDLPRVFGVLMTSKDPATRDHAIVVLRNWLGRQPGQTKKLYTSLLESKKVTEVQARNLLHLLFGFSMAERADPDTYSVLLAYMDHKNQGVRALAHWHLVRLAPAGKDIAFDAAAPEDARRAALQRWQALIPEGKLPPTKN